MYYCQGNFDDPETYKRLKVLLDKSEKDHGTQGNALFYLSVQPVYFGQIPAQLKAQVHERGNQRPLAARHYREAVRARPRLLAGAQPRHRRGAGGKAGLPHRSFISEKRRRRTSSSSGWATACSSRSGTAPTSTTFRSRWPSRSAWKDRGAFYETAGAFRDVMQNHMFMLLALVAMEPPNSFSGEAVRNEKVKLLDSMRLLTPEGGRERHHPRPIRPRRGRRQAGARLSAGAERRSELDGRDLRRDEAVGRQLALGRRPLLSPFRQAAGQAQHRDCHPLQERAARYLRRQRERSGWPEPPHHPHPAGGGNQPAGAGEDSRPDHPHARREDGFWLQPNSARWPRAPGTRR